MITAPSLPPEPQSNADPVPVDPQWHRRLLDLIPDGFCVIELVVNDDDRIVDIRFRDTNPAFVRFVGREDADGKLASEIFPALEPHWFEHYERVYGSGEPAFFVERSESLGRWYEVSLTRIGDRQERMLTCLFRDVTPLRRLGDELMEQRERLQVTLRSIADAVITTDACGRVSWMNPAAERLTGWPSSEAKGSPVTRIFVVLDERTRLPVPDPVTACLTTGAVTGRASGTVLMSRNGDEYGIEDSVAPMRDGEGEGDLLGAVLVFRDVSEQRRLSSEMSYRASHDVLTGLVNRQELEVRLARALAEGREGRDEHALMYIDLDRFKVVNDSCGHAVGDELLQQVSRLLREAVRAGDTVARIGGDEFAVILPGCTSEQAVRAGQQICDRMDGFRFEHRERRFRIGTSIGIVPLDDRWRDGAVAMQAADVACYAAKDAGRNRVHRWVDTDQGLLARSRQTQWVTRLEEALDRGRLELHAQRIEPANGAPDGLRAEVLIRLRGEDGVLVGPDAFLPAAERFHLVTRMDLWVLGRALGHLGWLSAASPFERLFVNLSGQSIGDRAFHRDAMELLEAAGPVVCGRLCLEITETTAVTSMSDAARFTRRVRALGVHVALDDFGAGASSFGYLKSLSTDVLKIDGQFIRDLLDEPLADVAVRCFVEVARVAGSTTVAEHVERPEVLERLREIGVDHVQGFLLHRPEPIGTLLASAAVQARARARSPASTAR